MKSKISILLLTCGAVALSPLSAQESVKPEVTVKPAQPIKPADSPGEPRREKEREEKKRPDQEGRGKVEKDKHKKSDHGEKPAPREKLTTYLGLMLRGVSPELAAQVGIPEGFGLLVADVAKDSPASEAKFETHDVVVMIGDQRVVNLPQFQALIRSQKKGDAVTLTIYRKGEEQKVSAKLGERMLPAEPPHGMHHPMMQGGHGMRSMHHPMMNRHKMEHPDRERRDGPPHKADRKPGDSHQPRPPMENGHQGNHPAMKPRGHSGPEGAHPPLHDGPNAKRPDGPPRSAPDAHQDERKERSPEGPRDGDRRPGGSQPPRPSKTPA